MLKKYPLYKIVILCIDLIALSLIAILSTKLFNLLFNTSLDFNFANYFFNCVIILFLIVILKTNGLYKLHLIFTAIKQISLIQKSIFIALLLLIIVEFFLSIFLLLNNPLFYLLFLFNTFLLFSLYRVLIIRTIIKGNRLTNFMKINTLIIGGGVKGKSLAVKMIDEEKYKLNIIGFIDDNLPKNKTIFNNLKNLGSVNEINTIVNTCNIDEIFISINNIDEKRILNIIDICLTTKCRINIDSDLFSVIYDKRITEEINKIPVINASRSTRWYFYTPEIFLFNFSIKRIIDLFLSSLILIFCSPLFLILGLIIKLSSEGPVFFNQTRIGYKEKHFKLYKFRSMKVGSDKDYDREKNVKEFILGKELDKHNTKIINEENITWIGSIIRKYSLDELPQLINIIKGDMSFVGPRPCLPYEKKNYLNWHKKRFQVLPGLTGLWQISGRSKVNFNDMIILDLYYIHNLTPWFDLEIFIKTIPIIFKGSGGK